MIQPVSALTPKVLSRGSNLSNPVNRRTEKRLAILNAGGISAVAGALTTVIARSYTASWKHASFWGVGAGLVTMMFICPRLLYRSGINSYKKERELDVFTKENEVQKKLLATRLYVPFLIIYFHLCRRSFGKVNFIVIGKGIYGGYYSLLAKSAHGYKLCIKPFTL